MIREDQSEAYIHGSLVEIEAETEHRTKRTEGKKTKDDDRVMSVKDGSSKRSIQQCQYRRVRVIYAQEVRCRRSHRARR